MLGASSAPLAGGGWPSAVSSSSSESEEDSYPASSIGLFCAASGGGSAGRPCLRRDHCFCHLALAPRARNAKRGSPPWFAVMRISSAVGFDAARIAAAVRCMSCSCPASGCVREPKKHGSRVSTLSWRCTLPAQWIAHLLVLLRCSSLRLCLLLCRRSCSSSLFFFLFVIEVLDALLVCSCQAGLERKATSLGRVFVAQEKVLCRGLGQPVPPVIIAVVLGRFFQALTRSSSGKSIEQVNRIESVRLYRHDACIPVRTTRAPLPLHEAGRRAVMERQRELSFVCTERSDRAGHAAC